MVAHHAREMDGWMNGWSHTTRERWMDGWCAVTDIDRCETCEDVDLSRSACSNAFDWEDEKRRWFDHDRFVLTRIPFEPWGQWVKWW
jgi:hypothetical protein